LLYFLERKSWEKKTMHEKRGIICCHSVVIETICIL